MSIDIPISLIRLHEQAVDELIDGELGTVCKLVYPPKHTECPNCLLDPHTNRSSNVYKSGGPVSFTNGTLCPVCYGEGKQTAQQEESIRVRLYTDPTKWVAMQIKVDNPTGIAQLIGYMNDMPKFQRASYIIANSKMQQMKDWRFE